MAKGSKTVKAPLTAEAKEAKEAKRIAKAAKFNTIGAKRMTAALGKIGLLGNLSNKSSYDYTQEQVDKMFAALSAKVTAVKAQFGASGAAKEDQFTF